MAGGVTIVIDDAEVVAALQRAEKAAENMTPLHEKIGAGMLYRTQRRFETESAPDGSKWPGLSPRTAAKRIGKGRRGYAHMLRVTNRLYQSMVYSADEKGAVTGTNVIYAALQNGGGQIQKSERQQQIHLGKVNGRTRFVKSNRVRKETLTVTIKAHTVTIPAREFLGFAEGDRTEVLRIAEEHYGEAGFNREAGK